MSGSPMLTRAAIKTAREQAVYCDDTEGAISAFLAAQDRVALANLVWDVLSDERDRHVDEDDARAVVDALLGEVVA